MMTLPYALYMAEQEGLLDTRESAIQNIIKRIKDYPEESVSNLVFYAICNDCGIQAGSLSEAEMMRIEQAIKS